MEMITKDRVLEGPPLEAMPWEQYFHHPYKINQYSLHSYGGERVVANSVSDNELFFRGGLLDYYQACYNKHRGVVISPDHLWHIVLYELATVVAADSEKYRDLFTTSKGKTTISIPTSSPEKIDLTQLVEELKRLVPSDIDIFVPELSVYDLTSYTAMCGAFCDLVSPYYSYMTFACGFPRIKIAGTDEDWQRLTACAITIGQLMPDIKFYTDRVAGVFTKMLHAGYDDLACMFSSQREGSGSYLWITGWIKDLFVNNSARRIEHFPNVVSKVKYNHENRLFYTMYIGVFGGEDCGDFVEPTYGFITEDTTSIVN